ncbi:Hint domain-containing protein [Phaeovulum sp.]|uniref:Hint domain-containing protein n=1 Tax=Phaeovulum sp. TaxID=2934796 RepID=UPI0035615068
MAAGAGGTFVISWAQTEVDGVIAAPPEALVIGSDWRWHGEVLRIDGPPELLLLTGQMGEADTRRRAARTVRRLLGAAVSGRKLGEIDMIEADAEQSFTVTDGYASYSVSLIELPGTTTRLLMFLGRVPPRDTELWVVDRALELRELSAPVASSSVICFTHGTLIHTPSGTRPVETLRPGDRVLTRDDGAQEIIWTGGRRISGARLHVMPEYRPVRFRAGAFGIGRPDGDLLVSPQHRMLVRGSAARALFNETEVLVSARDLVNGGSVRIEHGLREVQYVHLMFERHQILRANGLETESFHPGATTLEMIAPEDRAGLLSLMPNLAVDTASYGGYARRRLGAAETAILRHELAA